MDIFCFEQQSFPYLSILDGENTHHKIEALFKSFAYAMKAAVAITGTEIPSTKGEI